MTNEEYLVILTSEAPDRHVSPKSPRMPPMKVSMLLHFYAVADAFTPEHSRTSRAYTQFVKELLRDGLIERHQDLLDDSPFLVLHCLTLVLEYEFALGMHRRMERSQVTPESNCSEENPQNNYSDSDYRHG